MRRISRPAAGQRRTVGGITTRATGRATLLGFASPPQSLTPNGPAP